MFWTTQMLSKKSNIRILKHKTANSKDSTALWEMWTFWSRLVSGSSRAARYRKPAIAIYFCRCVIYICDLLLMMLIYMWWQINRFNISVFHSFFYLQRSATYSFHIFQLRDASQSPCFPHRSSQHAAVYLVTHFNMLWRFFIIYIYIYTYFFTCRRESKPAANQASL